MYRNIVLAFDGSREGRAALKQGVELARLCQAQVHLLSVLRISAGNEFGEGLFSLEELEGENVRHLRELVDEGLDLIRQYGVEAQGHIAFGQPIEQIPRLAQSVAADLIVVGHRHRGPMARWWQSSLSHGLIDHVDCSVLVAYAPAEIQGTSE